MEGLEEAGRCVFFHRWSRWTIDTETGIQNRMCLRCGRAEERSYKAPDGKCRHIWEHNARHEIGGGDKTAEGFMHVRACRSCGVMTGWRVDRNGVHQVGGKEE